MRNLLSRRHLCARGRSRFGDKHHRNMVEHHRVTRLSILGARGRSASQDWADMKTQWPARLCRGILTEIQGLAGLLPLCAAPLLDRTKRGSVARDSRSLEGCSPEPVSSAADAA